MDVDVRKLLKVYNVVNDERRHKINLKFAGALLAFVASGAALVAFALFDGGGSAPSPGDDGMAATGDGRTQTECVSVADEAIGSGVVASQDVEELYRQWSAEHPGADVVAVEPIYVGSVHTGYCITTRVP